MKFLDTLNKIHTRLDRLGDLPVFSATINRIQQVSSSPESDAMALAMAVMKDANLSARLLRLANSARINRGRGHISVISRAVILIGFDEIRNLCVTLKLIEALGARHAPEEIGRLVLRAFLNANIARELAARAGLDDIEATYTCGLLHNLGETVVAYTLPETYARMRKLRQQGGQAWERIQLEELGGHFADIGQDLAQSWGFPVSVVHAMDPLTAEDLRGEARTSFEIVHGSARVLAALYDGNGSFSEAVSQLGAVVGDDDEALVATLNRAFRHACDLTQEYGISARRLIPPVRAQDEEAQSEFSRKLAFYIHARAQDEDEGEEAPRAPAPPVADSVRLERQLHYLEQLTALVSEGAPLPKILLTVVDAIQHCTGLSRTALCLLSRDHREISVRLVRGDQSEPLRAYFTLARNPESEFFFRLLERQGTLLVNDLDEPGWRERLPEAFVTRVNPAGFILAPLASGKKVIGFVYSDRRSGAGPVTAADFRAFSQFQMQVRLALAQAQRQQKPD